jgi:hypothetical protein
VTLRLLGRMTNRPSFCLLDLGAPHSALMLAALMIGHHFSISAL